MIFWAFMIFLVIPVTYITLYVALHHYKESKLLKLIAKIQSYNSDTGTKEAAAAQIIRIIHKNKRLTPPQPISIDIHNSAGALVSFYILKAEVRHLINSIQEIRNQKTYVHSVPIEMRSSILGYLDEVNRFFANINTPYLDFEFRSLLLAKLYRNAVIAYLSIPDEKGHEEMKYIPLLEIIDKAQTKHSRIFPVFLEKERPQ
jgi:hypothetical protein